MTAGPVSLMPGTARAHSALDRLARENTSGTIVDRKKELSTWADVCQQTTKRGSSVFVHVNNSYAGHAPVTVAQFSSCETARHGDAEN